MKKPAPASSNRRLTLDRRRRKTTYHKPERRQGPRRGEDRLNSIIYYTMLAIMGLVLLAWAAAIELFKGALHAA